MTTETKGILIWKIIEKLNEAVKKENKELCERNLHAMQKPLHGGDMFFRLSFVEDGAIEEISAACGL